MNFSAFCLAHHQGRILLAPMRHFIILFFVCGNPKRLQPSKNTGKGFKTKSPHTVTLVHHTEAFPRHQIALGPTRKVHQIAGLLIAHKNSNFSAIFMYQSKVAPRQSWKQIVTYWKDEQHDHGTHFCNMPEKYEIWYFGAKSLLKVYFTLKLTNLTDF